MSTYQCPRCERVSDKPNACRGSAERPHPPTTVRPAEHLREALELAEPVPLDRLDVSEAATGV